MKNFRKEATILFKQIRNSYWWTLIIFMLGILVGLMLARDCISLSLSVLSQHAVNDKADDVKICSGHTYLCDEVALWSLRNFRSEGYIAIIWNELPDAQKLNITTYDDEKIVTYHTGIWSDYQEMIEKGLVIPITVSDDGLSFKDKQEAERTLKDSLNFESDNTNLLIWHTEDTEEMRFSLLVEEEENAIYTFESDIPLAKWDYVKSLMVAEAIGGLA